MVGFSKGSNHIPYKGVLEEVSEESILYYYTGISYIPILMNSPLRKDDNPSFRVTYSSTDRIRLIDFGTGRRYNLVSFLSELFNLSYIEVLQKITTDLEELKKVQFQNFKDIKILRKERKKKISSSSNITVRVRNWKEHDEVYWNSFGISKEWAIFGKIYPISHIFLDERAVSVDKYAYCYVEFKDGKPSYKIYQPYSEKWKWMSTHNSSVWDLWEQAMKSKDKEKLIITSSRKDALALWSNLGITSVSLQSENISPKKQVVKILKNTFREIFVLFDNDSPGVKASTELSSTYNFKNIIIPNEWEVKDPSDFYKKYGQDIYIKTFKKLII